ncbi:Holliday junction branch migration protein RuvA [bacterium]|nr:Holliday junction branch migration protein RuvA [bacterium]
MFSYIIGNVTEINNDSIVIEANKVGYLVYVANPFSYELNQEYKVYLYNKIGEDEYSLYGFKTKDEYSLFIKLISVKGLGPKIALPILATGSITGIADAIERENILYLKKFPKIGEKLAKQMILDLKGKIDVDLTSGANTSDTEEVIETLVALGYKQTEIRKIIGKINTELTMEEQVKEALKLLLK